MLGDLAARGLRNLPSDAGFVRARYIEGAAVLACTLALSEDAVEVGEVLGLQVLIRGEEGDDYNVPEGWGVIGTHVSPHAARKGVGAALFKVTRDIARAQGLEKIDATIGAENEAGLGYYKAMGFVTYAKDGRRVRKSFAPG